VLSLLALGYVSTSTSLKSLWNFLGALKLTSRSNIPDLTVFTTITYLLIFTGFTVIMGMIHFQKFCEAERNEF